MKKPGRSSRSKEGFLPGIQEMHSFAKPLESSILSFNDWINECLILIDTVESRSCFQEDVIYFIENREKHPDARYADRVQDKSNSAILQRMKAFLESERDTINPKKNWKPALYARIPIDTISAKLKEKYGC